MTVSEILRDFAFAVAEELNAPIAFDGEPFIAPAGPWLLCSIGPLEMKAAALGRDAPTRVDGWLELAASDLAGGASCLAAKVVKKFPRGLGLSFDDPSGCGEIVFAAPASVEAASDAGRVNVRISFYAIIFPKEEK